MSLCCELHGIQLLSYMFFSEAYMVKRRRKEAMFPLSGHLQSTKGLLPDLVRSESEKSWKVVGHVLRNLSELEINWPQFLLASVANGCRGRVSQSQAPWVLGSGECLPRHSSGSSLFQLQHWLLCHDLSLLVLCGTQRTYLEAERGSSECMAEATHSLLTPVSFQVSDVPRLWKELRKWMVTVAQYGTYSY